MYGDILRQHRPPGNTDNVRQLFNRAEAAPTLPDTVPKGEYVTHWIDFKEDHARTGSPRVVLTFKVVEGDFVGKRLWLDLYLTPKAVARSKRELAKLGVMTSDDFLKPIPHWVRCLVRVIVETDDDGKPRNRIVDFKATAFDQEQPDPFAPQPEGGAA